MIEWIPISWDPQPTLINLEVATKVVQLMNGKTFTPNRILPATQLVWQTHQTIRRAGFPDVPSGGTVISL